MQKAKSHHRTGVGHIVVAHRRFDIGMSDDKFCTFYNKVAAFADFLVVESIVKTENDNIGHVLGERNSGFFKVVEKAAVSYKIN